MKKRIMLVTGLLFTLCTIAFMNANASSFTHRFAHHFNSSGWNTPRHLIGTCYRSEHNQSLFGTKYKLNIISDLGNKKFDVSFENEDGAGVMANVTGGSISTASVEVSSSRQSLTTNIFDPTISEIRLYFKKPLTATWSYDLVVDVDAFVWS